MTREIYLDIIRKKTGILFGVSAGVGAMSVGASGEEVARMRELGEIVGMAFQIRDDILDYDPRTDTGKPLCNDLAEQKITLPLLVVLERSGEERRAELMGRLAAIGDEGAGCLDAGMPGDFVPEACVDSESVGSGVSGADGRGVRGAREDNIAYLRDAVLAEGGIEESEKVMRSFIDRAHELLSHYPASPYRDSLGRLASYAAGRGK